jgi:hypothetical protein
MEFFLGSVITLLVALILYNKTIGKAPHNKKDPFKYTQSQIYSIVTPRQNPKMFGVAEIPPTQSSQHARSHGVRVALYEDKAYWISNNSLFVADIHNGLIDQDSTKIVDTMGVDKVELNKLSTIVEKLNEESANDNRNPGNEKLF